MARLPAASPVHEAARRRALALREQALDDAWDRMAAWLRRAWTRPARRRVPRVTPVTRA